MSKKEYDIDTDLGDLGFDSSLDLDDPMLVSSNKKSKKREVIDSFKEGFTTSVSDSMTDQSYIRDLVRLGLPRGYSQAWNAYDSTRQEIGKIFKENDSELTPYMAKANRALNRRGKRLKRFLPPFLKNALSDAEDREKYSGASSAKGPSELEEGLSGINKLFAMDAASKAEDRIEGRRKEILENKKFRLGIGLQTDLASGINKLVAYQDRILINYHKKSLELNLRQYDVQSRMLKYSKAFYTDAVERLDAIQKNTGLPDYVKLNKSEVLKERLRQKLADATISTVDKYRRQFFANISQSASGLMQGVLGQLSMFGSMTGGMGDATPHGMAGHMTGSLLADKASEGLKFAGQTAAEKLAPFIEKIPGMKGLGNRLQYFLTDPTGVLNRFKQSEDSHTGILGSILGFFKNMIPGMPLDDKIKGKGLESLGDPAIFDNRVHSSITEIIPGYLESMDRSLRSLLSGEDEEGMAWSHYTGSMVTRSTLDNQHMRIGIQDRQGFLLKDRVSNLISELGADTLSPKAQDALARRLARDLHKGQDYSPKDYVGLDTWVNLDENTADEIIDFFTTKYNLDYEGNPLDKFDDVIIGDSIKFKEASESMPATMERARVLSDVMGRDALRRMNLADYDGTDGDVINMENWIDYQLGSDLLKGELSKEIEWKKSDKKGIRGVWENSKNEYDAKLADKKKEEEDRVIQLRSLGKEDIIDQVQAKRNIKDSTGGTSTSGGTNNVVNQVSMPDFNMEDIGTHSRLDIIIKAINKISSENNQPTQSTQQYNQQEESVDYGEMISKGYQKGKDKLLDTVSNVKDKASEIYNTNPRVKKVVDKIEETYGKITDKEAWNKLILEVEKKTGTPEEIFESLKSKFDETLGKATELKGTVIQKGKEALDVGKTIYENRGEIKDEVLERGRELGNQAVDKGSALLSRGRSALSGLGDKMGAGLAAMSFKDKGTHKRLDAIIKMLPYMGSEKKQGILSKIAGSVVKGVGGGIKGFGKLTAGVFGVAGSFAGSMTKAALAIPLGIAKGVGGAFFGDAKYGVRDVKVIGDEEVRLRAKDIEKGKYQDVNTKKVIKGLKDITGPVIDIDTGNEVISKEEFEEKKLVDGKGKSLARFLGGKAVGLGVGYTKGVLGIFGKIASVGLDVVKGAFSVLTNQFTQFDAYLPGDEEPRIRSKLLKEGYYRDKEGKVIESIDQINGPVYDIKGNEIVSQEEIDEHKTFYKKNGSVLFKIGRAAGGMARAVGRGIGMYYKATFGLMWKAVKGTAKLGFKAVKGLGKGVMSLLGFKRKGSGSGDGDELTQEILISQLEVQANILQILQAMNTPSEEEKENENSWDKVISRRASRDAKKAEIEKVPGPPGSEEDGNKSEGGLMSAGVAGVVGGLAAKGLDAVKSFIKNPFKARGPAARFGTQRALPFAAKTAFRVILPGLLKGAIAVGSAIVSAVGLPVILVGLAIAGAVYVGVKYYKSKKKAKVPLHTLRMAQYGVAWDSERAEKILQLEYLLSNSIKGIDTDEPQIDAKAVEKDQVKMLQIFNFLSIKTTGEGDLLDGAQEDHDINSYAEELSKINPKDLAKWEAWLGNRFRPVFLRHRKALHEIEKISDFKQADEKIKSKEGMHEYITKVFIPDADHVYDDVHNSPFTKTSSLLEMNKLHYNAKDVRNTFDWARKIADKAPTSAELLEKANKDETKDKPDPDEVKGYTNFMGDEPIEGPSKKDEKKELEAKAVDDKIAEIKKENDIKTEKDIIDPVVSKKEVIDKTKLMSNIAYGNSQDYPDIDKYVKTLTVSDHNGVKTGEEYILESNPNIDIETRLNLKEARMKALGLDYTKPKITPKIKSDLLFQPELAEAYDFIKFEDEMEFLGIRKGGTKPPPPPPPAITPVTNERVKESTASTATVSRPTAPPPPSVSARPTSTSSEVEAKEIEDVVNKRSFTRPSSPPPPSNLPNETTELNLTSARDLSRDITSRNELRKLDDLNISTETTNKYLIDAVTYLSSMDNTLKVISEDIRVMSDKVPALDPNMTGGDLNKKTSSSRVTKEPEKVQESSLTEMNNRSRK